VPPLRVRKLARSEIDAAYTWYLHHSPDAAQCFLNAADEAMSLMLTHPNSIRSSTVVFGAFCCGGSHTRCITKCFPASSVSSVLFTDIATRRPGCVEADDYCYCRLDGARLNQ
jgi:plasmid stabilization system protein ParE